MSLRKIFEWALKKLRIKCLLNMNVTKKKETLPKGKVVERTKKKENLPMGKVVKGTNQLQVLCPVCEYGDGYNEPIMPGDNKKIEVVCETCGTRFIALG